MRRYYLLLFTLLFAGCGDAGASDESVSFGTDAGSSGDCFNDNDCPSGYACFANQCTFQGGAGPMEEPDPPPERERTIQTFAEPAAGRVHVWVPSPSTNSVVRVQAETLDVDRTEVGVEPTIVRVHTAHDNAVVLCRGSDELVVIRTPEDVTFHPLPVHANALTLTPDGTHAIAWLDLEELRMDEDATNIQEVSILALETGMLRTVTVGFRPSSVHFAGDLAYIITDDGVSIFTPTAEGDDAIAPTAPVATDVLNQVEREVLVTADGAFAVSRGPGEPGITITDLSDPLTAVPQFIELPGVPTDLDLVPDTHKVLVMMRATQILAVVTLDPAEDEEAVRYTEHEGHVLGSALISADGQLAMLYTTIDDPELRPRVSLLEVPTGHIIHKPLRKRVHAAALDPFGQVAVLTHIPETPAVDAEGGEQILAESYGYTLLDMQTGFTKLIGTHAEPFGLSFSPNQPIALMLLSDVAGGIAEVQHIDLSGFAVRGWSLGRTPEVAGMLPEIGRGFVTQNHPEGRISFLRLDAPEVGPETLSGYALNARIQ